MIPPQICPREPCRLLQGGGATQHRASRGNSTRLSPSLLRCIRYTSALSGASAATPLPEYSTLFCGGRQEAPTAGETRVAAWPISPRRLCRSSSSTAWPAADCTAAYSDSYLRNDGDRYFVFCRFSCNFGWSHVTWHGPPQAGTAAGRACPLPAPARPAGPLHSRRDRKSCWLFLLHALLFLHIEQRPPPLRETSRPFSSPPWALAPAPLCRPRPDQRAQCW